jgi:sulfide:quinone oxidoreductase
MKALVLGGGFGGIVTAHTLRNILGGEHDITLVNENSDFYLRAAFPRMAFQGEITPESIRLPLDRVLPGRGINFKKARVTAIYPESNAVETSEGGLRYDYLVIALGTHYATESIPGLREYSYSLWTVDEAQRLGAKLRNFTGGSFVTGAAVGSPCEEPTWESIMQMEYFVRSRGIRDKVELHHFTDKEQALQPVGPAGHRWGAETFPKLGIHVHTKAEVAQVTHDRVIFRDGREVQADIALVMAPYKGHSVIVEAGLGDEVSFISVDKTMRTRSYRNIFAIGDSVSIPKTPKMAHNAMRAGRVAATNVASEIMGTPGNWEFHNEIMCIIENGGNRGTYVRSNMPWGGNVSIVMGAHSDVVGLTAEEAIFIKKSFGEHFLATGGNINYIM